MRNALLYLCVLASFGAWSQNSLKYQEVQFSVGTMSYNGELTASLDPGTLLKELGYYGAFDYTHYFGPKWGIGTRVGYGKLYGDDANHDHPERGFAFRSDLVEWNGHLIYHFSRFGKYHQAFRTTFYGKLSTGAAWVHTTFPSNVQIPAKSVIYPGTNGGFNLGFGAGVKFRIATHSALSIELMGHYLFSDLIEGISFPDDNGTDGYGGLRIGYIYQLF